MTKEELTKGMTYLGMAYGKTFTQAECELYYDFLQEYSYDTFVKAVKKIIKKSKFIPKVNELVEECENCKTTTKIEILEYMDSQGYFKAGSEYDKAIMFLEKNIVPEWLQKDINYYYKMMISNRLETNERVMISG